MLNDDDKSLVEKLFAQGPAVLFENGMDEAGVSAFIQRPDVKTYFLILQREFSNQEVISATTKFVARRQLARLQGGAAAVLGAALAGPEFKRAPDGTYLRSASGAFIPDTPPVTTEQIRAAEQVLDRLGVVHTQSSVSKAADTNIILTLAQGEETKKLMFSVEGGSKGEMSLSREKVRTAIEMLKGELGALVADVQKKMSGPKPRPKKTKTTKK